MRRMDREVTDKNEIIKIIDKCDACRIAMWDGQTPYIVPVNFGYEYKDEELTLYFHGAGEGRKIEILKKFPNVCIEMDCSHRLVTDEEACNCTMEYESVIGSGTMEIVQDTDEKIIGMNQVMKKYIGEKEFSYSEKRINAVTILKLRLKDFTGKRLMK